MTGRLLAIILSIFSAIIYLVGCNSAAKEEGKLIASGHPYYPPIMWKEGNTITGAASELADKLFSDLKIKYEIIYDGPWEKVLQDAKTGKIDVIIAAYKNDERLEYLEYTDPIAEDPVCVFTLKGVDFRLRKFGDLTGKKGAAAPGESFGEEFDDMLKEKLSVERIKLKDAFAKLADGKLDYVVAGKSQGIIAAKLSNTFNKVDIQPYTITMQYFYMCFSKKSKFVRHIPEINKKLRKYETDALIDLYIYRNQMKWQDLVIE